MGEFIAMFGVIAAAGMLAAIIALTAVSLGAFIADWRLKNKK